MASGQVYAGDFRGSDQQLNVLADGMSPNTLFKIIGDPFLHPFEG
jgi:hypothetical protein